MWLLHIMLIFTNTAKNLCFATLHTSSYALCHNKYCSIPHLYINLFNAYQHTKAMQIRNVTEKQIGSEWVFSLLLDGKRGGIVGLVKLCATYINACAINALTGVQQYVCFYITLT